MATPLAKKLLIKPGNIVLLINPPDGYRNLLGDLPDDVTIVGPGSGPGQVVQLFVRTQTELHAEAEAALEALTPGGVFWISYPKVASGLGDLSREALWDALPGHDGPVARSRWTTSGRPCVPPGVRCGQS